MVIENNYVSQSIDVSVIVITFNPDLKKLYKTLDSVFNQNGICYEIIVCDDGSKLKFENELNSYFSLRDFNRFTLVFHEHHRGTVSNYYSGLELARGKYVKVISPGDWLASPTILSEWLDYLERSGKEWSFSDIFSYGYESGKEKWLRTRAYPQHVHPYLKQNDRKCIWNYIALRDIAKGAAMFGTTQIQRIYCKTIMDKGVIYCEDLMYLLMMFNGYVGCYFPKEAFCYEYGTGISKSTDTFWRDAILKDNRAVDRIMAEKNNPSPLQKSIVDALGKINRTEKLFIKGKVLHWLMLRIFPRMTRIPKMSNYSKRH